MVMLRKICILGTLVGAALVASNVAVAQVTKCTVGGTVTYQQGPCPSNEVRKPPTIEQSNAEAKKRRAATAPTTSEKVDFAAPLAPRGFSCDGRKQCAQMTSCAEAKYFLANCPGVKMDGDNDGIPCEQQWCVRSR